MSLVIFEIDKAITDKRPVEPTLLDILDDLGADAKAEREKQNSKLMGCYEIEKINWERSNRKWLMVIKGRISEGIRGQSRSVRLLWSTWRRWRISSLALQRVMQALIKRLVSEKYTGGGVRDHILMMSNVTARLKPPWFGYQGWFLDLFDL
jgi:hypothetical protein